MKIFKFGGASINSIERIQNVAKLLRECKDEELIIIISAMGKVTNALEKVAEAFYENKTTEAHQLFDVIKRQHNDLAKYLLVTNFIACDHLLQTFYESVEKILAGDPVGDFDFWYDQLVSTGELLSTTIVSHYLNEVGIKNNWMDVRKFIKTDDNYRDAVIDWEQTSHNILKWKQQFDREENDCTVNIFQGFIGSTSMGKTTTLGREGSDFSAAIFGNVVDAESVTIWKDVEGVMSADPRIFPDAKFIQHLSYNEVIEMAYYGAQVIHPKTIKPLQNKGIPLYVKCFSNPALPGTVINGEPVKDLPPIVVLKEKQALLLLTSKDFSFVGHKPMSMLYDFFGQIKIWPNLIQTEAISLEICMDDKSEKLSLLAEKAAEAFEVQVQRELTLLTIRHYTEELLNSFLVNKKSILTQKTKDTVQVLLK